MRFSTVRRSIALTALVGLLAACSPPGTAPAPGPGRLRVVAAENVWASLARQLGGRQVAVRTIIVNPTTDPHSYQPTAADAVALASSQVAIVNGLGYDGWASRLLAANPSRARIVINVGEALGLGARANPHQWYSPAAVGRITGRIVAGYVRLDAADRMSLLRRQADFDGRALAAYHRLIAQIRARYGGVAVGYSESIFQPLGTALGLRLLTPSGFAKANSEGVEVSAGDRRTVEAQARSRQMKVWVYNSQDPTPDVARVGELARAAGIPIVTVTETLAPPEASFQGWQVAQLRRLERALHRATGR